MPRLAVALVFAIVALAAPALAQAQVRELVGTVGADATITLRDAAGRNVTRLEPGPYRITVHDRTDFHNFRLDGPGVNLATSVEEVETVVWNVTLVDGVYTFLCDPHANVMRGQFAVGSAQLPTPPPPAAPPTVRRLVATVGPGATISVLFNGRRATHLAPGRYRITVRDRSRLHNFHLTGPGVNRRTSVAALGTFTWTVTLRRGTYRFLCDPHARRMRGSFAVH